MKTKLLLLFLLTSFTGLCSASGIDEPESLKQEGKRRLTKNEIRFLENKVDSIKRNLNRMIRFEKQLMQRNYYLNEKTALVDDLISTIQYLQKSADVIDIREQDIRKIFGKWNARAPGKIYYEIETYRSNCPFMELIFHERAQGITKIEYKITDCQKWK